MRHLLLAAALLAAVPASAAVTFAGKIEVAGDATDLSKLGVGPNLNRLSFGSDMVYDPSRRVFYGISDRGPGGGTIDWAPRIETFKVDTAANGAISNFRVVDTTEFRQANGQVFSGLNPSRLPGGAGVLGAALDSEGIVRLPNGNFLVADEYGPSVYETNNRGVFIRAFTQPANVVPLANGSPDFANGRPTITSGRQDNRGYEGLTISGDGKTAWAILQDPLVNEGSNNDGRRSQNLRIVQFDVATGQSTGQFAYQLESIADINARTTTDFTATNQGRSIGVSSITWIGGTSFLVIERDNRGEGPDNLLSSNGDVGSKRVYLIDLAGATDVSAISFAGSNSLPGGVTPVSKLLFLDVQAALTAAGEVLPEKLEGLAIGPRLAGGGFALLLATDNDFSVTQNGSNEQFDVCFGGGLAATQVALGAACPNGQALVPSRLYSFAVTGADVALFDASLIGVPEPASWAMLIAGFGLVGAAARRRRATVAA
ncbi:esterase-like activity of phytase family protein [Sandarakinorhabdus sp. AAP62]|uniref:esterase-like activity of phytase family protein n=1 Tax=Sandarakinorhabdus sp. AAP62 TaxID=1248916 RepID=UPI0002D7E3AD|nr:esterase-like activity of phytase family protein [Sandarakinorhabdus sp. AAP62]